MTQLTPFGTSPFDILFKDFFKADVDYQSYLWKERFILTQIVLR